MTKAQSHTHTWKYNTCAVIVAHPDDETLWAGGTILEHPESSWTIISLTRKSDSDRNPKFFKALKELNADGDIADLDDGPEQKPLNLKEIQQVITTLLPQKQYDLVITHSLLGEYTRHRRHEETAEAVLNLWCSGWLKTKKLRMFAYHDKKGAQLPAPIAGVDSSFRLNMSVWGKKYSIITNIYGFSPDSWEARAAPKKEAFWVFGSPEGIREWIMTGVV